MFKSIKMFLLKVYLKHRILTIVSKEMDVPSVLICRLPAIIQFRSRSFFASEKFFKTDNLLVVSQKSFQK